MMLLTSRLKGGGSERLEEIDERESSSRGGTKRKRKREAGQRRGCKGWASWEGPGT